VTVLIKWKCVQNFETIHVKRPVWESVCAEDGKEKGREVWMGFIWLRLGKRFGLL
jgi:hypothetical protein